MARQARTRGAAPDQVEMLSAWRLRSERLQERYRDLERDHELLKEQHRELSLDYQHALARLWHLNNVAVGR